MLAQYSNPLDRASTRESGRESSLLSDGAAAAWHESAPQRGLVVTHEPLGGERSAGAAAEDRGSSRRSRPRLSGRRSSRRSESRVSSRSAGRSRRKAQLEEALVRVGQREGAEDDTDGAGRLRHAVAFTSRLWPRLTAFMEADDNLAEEGEGQVLKYDNAAIVRYGLFFSCKGTAIADPFTLLQLLLLFLVAAGIGLGAGNLWTTSSTALAPLTSITATLTTLVAFMVGLCVSAALARWWQIREGCIGGLWGAIDDLCLVAGSIFADDDGTTVWVANLPDNLLQTGQDTTKDTLRETFGVFGRVVKVILREKYGDPSSGRPKNQVTRKLARD